jgi:hypothetical protein
MRLCTYRLDRVVGKLSGDAAARWLEATLGV